MYKLYAIFFLLAFTHKIFWPNSILRRAWLEKWSKENG